MARHVLLLDAGISIGSNALIMVGLVYGATRLGRSIEAAAATIRDGLRGPLPPPAQEAAAAPRADDNESLRGPTRKQVADLFGAAPRRLFRESGTALPRRDNHLPARPAVPPRGS